MWLMHHDMLEDIYNFHISFRHSSTSPQHRSGPPAEKDPERQDRPQCGAGGWSANSLPRLLHRLCQDDAA